MSWLDEEPAIDWSDFADASSRAIAILERLSRDHDLLSDLTHAVPDNEHLFGLCEQHALDDKIVIYDALPSRNFRIRWRLATQTEYERVHQHRFSFATHVLKGVHHETVYRRISTREPASLEDFVAVTHKECVAGQSFAIHSSGFHSTTTSGGAIGLLLRGPAELRQALIIRKEDGESWYRLGAKDESPERRQEVAMSRSAYDSWIKVLVQEGLVQRGAEPIS